MPLKLPNLDDRRYKDLVEEGRSLIPTYAQEWTNHNPSDPGITLIELFAYLTEMMNYRLNRVTIRNKIAFLKLLNGPDWQPAEMTTEYVNNEIRNTVLELRRPGRAITRSDFESLVTAPSDSFNSWLEEMRLNESTGGSLAEWWSVTGLEAVPENNPSAMAGTIRKIGRARCVPRRNIITQTQSDFGTERPGHISMVIVPERSGDESNPLPAAELVRAVRNYLEPRRLLTTVVHVAGLRYFAVGVRLTIVLKPDADEDKFRFKYLGEWNGTDIPPLLQQAFINNGIELSGTVTVSPKSESEWLLTDETTLKTYVVRKEDEGESVNIYEEIARYEAITELKKFLDPLDGGDDGKGWPFGRNVYVSEIFELLDGLSWVDYVKKTDTATGTADELTVDAAATSRLIRNETGDLIAVEIQPYELVSAGITPADITIQATRSA